MGKIILKIIDQIYHQMNKGVMMIQLTMETQAMDVVHLEMLLVVKMEDVVLENSCARTISVRPPKEEEMEVKLKNGEIDSTQLEIKNVEPRKKLLRKCPCLRSSSNLFLNLW